MKRGHADYGIRAFIWQNVTMKDYDVTVITEYVSDGIGNASI
jgi:hypothetical protein